MTMILSIGHSNHEWDVFARLLATHSVSCILDVRSSPYSRYTPQFNREALAERLHAAGIDCSSALHVLPRSAESDSALHVTAKRNSALHVKFGAACTKTYIKFGAVCIDSALHATIWRREKEHSANKKISKHNVNIIDFLLKCQ